MFEMPKLLPYPEFQQFDRCQELLGKFCYFIKDYAPGYSILIKRQSGEAGIILGDWKGNKYDHKCPVTVHIASLGLIEKFHKIMEAIGLQQGQLFFSSDDRVVDLQIAINKMAGPGMLRDLFATTFSIQDTVKIEVATPQLIAELKKQGRFIVKPSRFRFIQRDQIILPLYARI